MAMTRCDGKGRSPMPAVAITQSNLDFRSRNCNITAKSKIESPQQVYAADHAQLAVHSVANPCKVSQQCQFLQSLT